MPAKTPWILIVQDPETYEVVDYVITNTKSEADNEMDNTMAEWPWCNMTITTVNSETCLRKMGPIRIVE